MMTARFVEALVDVVAIEFVMTQSETRRTAALVRSFSVYANVRAVVYFLTLIHVMASCAVRAQHKSGFASATMRADEINADIRAIAIVLDAFIHVEAGKAVSAVQFVSIMTRAGEGALDVYAAMLASI